jgi:integrase
MAGRVEALQVAALTLVKPAPRGTVKESTKRRGVQRKTADAILPFLSPPVRSIVELMWTTCARPDELCRLRVRDIARGGSILMESAIELDIDSLGVWAAVLSEHKTDDPESEFDRVIFFGPKSQAILRGIIDDGRGEADYLFRPADGRAAFIEGQRAKRKPGGYGSYKKVKGEAAKRKPREAYDSQTVRNSVIRACERAKVPIFTPYQIRHSVFKLTQARYGRDTARAFGGHRVGGATENYAGFDLTAAAKVARETG